jgi:heme-degrading monooxygenase HmoA
MPVIVVTRLRVKDPELTDAFFTTAVALLEQARASEGILGSDVLADANNAWWTVTGWQTRQAIQDYVHRDPHLSAMNHLDEWCDEASFVDWEQDGTVLPSWQTAYQHLVDAGTSASLSDASPANATRRFPAPVEPNHP